MRWPPQGNVLTEDAMPDVVERESEKCIHPATRHQHPADRGMPVASDSHRRGARLVERQDDGNHARQEYPEQADDDEVMRRVGQRTGIAAVADVPANVPDESEQR